MLYEPWSIRIRVGLLLDDAELLRPAFPGPKGSKYDRIEAISRRGCSKLGTLPFGGFMVSTDIEI